MNCKLSKLFFIALTLGVTYSSQAQTEEERRNIVESYRKEIKNYDEVAKQIVDQYNKNYDLALQKAKELGKPIEGVDSKGKRYSLAGYDEQSGALLYYTSSNNVGTTSSIRTARVHHLQTGGSLGLDINGENMIAGIWDEGALSNSNALTGRVTMKDNTTIISGHSTHVAGTVASSGQGGGNLVSTKGMAPAAKLWANSWVGDIAEMTAQAGQGLLVSNHSYGYKTNDYVATVGVSGFGRYDEKSQSFDQISNNFPNYSIVVAAGNDRADSPAWNPTKNGKDLLSGTAVAKNPVVVAAIHGKDDGVGVAQITAFSNYGPTDDFRIKPDISAKGWQVVSLGITSPVATATENGTSMAAPSVTGVFTLWQQLYKQLFGNYMRAATVKALMAHTAEDAGVTGPDYRFGWGIINAKDGAVVMLEKEQQKALILENTLNNGGFFEYEFDYQGLKPLNATIAWTDPAAAPNGGNDLPLVKLINDLDLRIFDVDTGEEFLPWALKKTFSTPDTQQASQKVDNNVDPVEKVEVGMRPAGRYKVVVRHKGTLTGGNQRYSLILTGFDEPLSTSDNVLTDVVVFPNPTVDHLNIQSTVADFKGASYEIYDLRGRILLKNVLTNNEINTIDLGGLNAGVYVVKVYSSGKTGSYKIVKK